MKTVKREEERRKRKEKINCVFVYNHIKFMINVDGILKTARELNIDYCNSLHEKQYFRQSDTRIKKKTLH